GFAARLRECIKRCENFVDAFMWRQVDLVGDFCREFCGVLHALRARLWTVQKDSSVLHHSVRINAMREIDFACDEVRAFLRAGPTGLCPEYEVALREVQLKVASSQNALILQLSAKMLNTRDTSQLVNDMVRGLQSASKSILDINPHDRPKLVACLWKIFLLTIIKGQEIMRNEHGDSLRIDSAVASDVGTFVETLIEVCPHIQPDDLELKR
ncbi:hypothetical protein BIW11_12965, partial [Tropilaelaps mercedesae]